MSLQHDQKQTASWPHMGQEELCLRGSVAILNQESGFNYDPIMNASLSEDEILV